VTTYTRTPLDAWVKAKIGMPPNGSLTGRALAAYQLDRLRVTLEYVKRGSPFYRRHFSSHTLDSLQCLSDLAQWPLTSADDLRRDPPAFLCISQSAVQRVVTMPSRSSQALPKRLYFSAADLELAVDFFHCGFSATVGKRQRMLVLMPCQRPDSVGDLLARGVARLAATPVRHGPMHSSREAVKSILTERIDCLVGTPTEVLALSQHSARDNIPDGQIKNIWLGTQNKLRSVAEEISRSWGCPVFQHYGAAEMCPGGGVQCAARDGFHLREADLLIEIVDPRTFRPVPDGAHGEVVVTTLTREAMPLVRYRTGHWAAFMTPPCPCGSKLRRLSAIAPIVKDPSVRKGSITHGPHR